MPSFSNFSPTHSKMPLSLLEPPGSRPPVVSKPCSNLSIFTTVCLILPLFSLSHKQPKHMHPPTPPASFPLASTFPIQPSLATSPPPISVLAITTPQTDPRSFNLAKSSISNYLYFPPPVPLPQPSPPLILCI